MPMQQNSTQNLFLTGSHSSAESMEAANNADIDGLKQNHPRQSTLDFIKQFARCCQHQPGLPSGLSAIAAN